MNTETSIQFLEQKLRLILSEPDRLTPPLFAANRARNVTMMFVEPLERIKRGERASGSSLRSFDAMIDQMLLNGLDKDVIEKINRKLIVQFGYCRLSKDPVSIAKRILKRARIQNSAEGEVARELIANQGAIDLIGAKSYKRLAELLDEWEDSGTER